MPFIIVIIQVIITVINLLFYFYAHGTHVTHGTHGTHDTHDSHDTYFPSTHTCHQHQHTTCHHTIPWQRHYTMSFALASHAVMADAVMA